MDDKNKTNEKPCKINLETDRCSLKGTVRPEDCMRSSKSNRCIYSKTYKKIKRKKEKKDQRKDKLDDNTLLKQMCQNSFRRDDRIDFKNSKMMNCLRLKETVEKNNLRGNDSNILYPTLYDPNFNMKIAHKKEFYDTKYDKNIQDIEKVAEKLCQFKEFELSPHQRFVRNFLSFQTPYNSLLLFHGLGTGKTCSSILVCEEMRHFNKQMGIFKKIIIVAAPNVQDNFKLQLFDERKLKNIDGNWTMQSCTSNHFLKEVNPMNMAGFTKDKIIRQVKRIIQTSYHFMGYSKFSNYIRKQVQKYENNSEKKIKALKKIFSGRLIVIDEVHNIRTAEEKSSKNIIKNLKSVVYHADNLKLLLLSATPMFNTYKEIIWLLNLMNLNDKRFPIKSSEIFDSNGNFIQDDDGNETGKELLVQKANGYISFVSGDNPYTFPYRILPTMFLPSKHLLIKYKTYPNKTVDGRDILSPIQRLDLVINKIGTYQEKAYEYVIQKMKQKFPSFKKLDSGLGYNVLEPPLQILNMAYPSLEFDQNDEDADIILYGKDGLNRIMNINHTRKQMSYKQETLKNYGRIFSKNEIGKYSSKINFICDRIRSSVGIVLIYSQYIDGGCVPIALALEEMGFRRYGDVPSLFKTKPKNIEKLFKFTPYYTMITGDKALSPNNNTSIKAITNDDNKYGEKIKVVIISRAASEGIDLKNIRQVHILDPWYNLNRPAQITGRAIRQCSHKSLPFKERNTEIYMYSTLLSDSNIEAIDLYIYRLAEKKAILIGKVSRVLKENAVDCILNKNQTGLTVEKMNQMVKQTISSGDEIDYPVGSKPYTALCDYMAECAYSCNFANQIEEINMDSYGADFMIMNLDMIIQIIRNIFKEHYYLKKNDLINRINYKKNYPETQINMALDQLINDKNLYIKDMLNRIGYLVNINDLYIFQPVEIDNKFITRYDRVHPIDYKYNQLTLNLPKKAKRSSKHIDKREEQRNVLTIFTDVEKYLTKPTIVKKGYKPNWYQMCYIVLHSKVTRTTKYRISRTVRQKILKYGIHHFIDSISYNQKLLLLNMLYKKKISITKNSIKDFAKKYFNSMKIVGTNGKKNIEGLLLNQKKTIFIHIFDKTIWRKATFIESKYFTNALKDRRRLKNTTLNPIVGFIDYSKSADCSLKNCFKIIFTKKKKDRGAFCGNKTKKDVISLLNNILVASVPIGVQQYTSDDIQWGVDKNKSIMISKIAQPQLCCELELIIRYYSENQVNKKIWFLSLVDAILCKIIK